MCVCVLLTCVYRHVYVCVLLTCVYRHECVYIVEEGCGTEINTMNLAGPGHAAGYACPPLGHDTGSPVEGGIRGSD